MSSFALQVKQEILSAKYSYQDAVELISGIIATDLSDHNLTQDFIIKLKEDKNIFVKLIFRDNDKLQKTFINFIPITKRFQHVNENDNLTFTDHAGIKELQFKTKSSPYAILDHYYGR